MSEWTGDNEWMLADFFGQTDEQTTQELQPYSGELIKLMTYYRCAIMEIETKFKVLNEEYSLEHDRNPISNIKTRLKSLSSIHAKLRERGAPMTTEAMEEELSDIAGVRVVCSFPEDVYDLAQALLKQDDIRLIRQKDYITHPKENGYRSLHMIVGVPIFLAQEKRIMRVEIQLRTIAMDFWASLEHQLRYKKSAEFTEDMAHEMSECARISAALDLRMDALRKQCLEQRATEGCVCDSSDDNT